MILDKLFALTLKDKKIDVPKGNNLVSPANGVIADIVRVSKDRIKIKKGLLGLIETEVKGIIKQGYVVSIFMRVWDNHLNRNPIDGKAVSVTHKKGNFRPACSLRALDNEKTETILKTKIGKIKIIQIAGILAKRIETFIKPGKKVKKGEVFGLIKLGSQVTMVLPSKVKLKVKKGQKVKAGSTIIGEF